MEDRGPLICVHSWELLGIRSWEVKDHLKKEPSLLHSVGDSSREKKKNHSGICNPVPTWCLAI